MYTQKNIDRFWKKVKKLETGLCCWVWTASLLKNGYGQFWADGNKYLAHRFSYQLHHNRLIEDGMCIMHVVCDNPSCVRPDHLCEGSHQDNMTDMRNKGRAAKGEKNSLSKLTVAQVSEIREKYELGGTSHKKLAEEYGVYDSTIGRIINYEIWAHI